MIEKTKSESGVKKRDLFKESNISLILDDYNDLFSDFDARTYSEKALSDDFLSEMKKASRDKPSGEIELNLLVPVKQRSFQHEVIIKKRLKDHFRKHHNQIKDEIKHIKKQGAYFVFFGILSMFVATYILLHTPETLIYTFLVILLEPGGWFLFWEGLDLIIFEPNKKKPELNFYEKMSKVDIRFHNY